MQFKCNIAPNAVPCTSIKTHDPTTGKKLDKPLKSYKVVKKGKTVTWVDRCSRKHFIAVDEDAKALNAKDFKDMKDELGALRAKLPSDATFAECADSLAKIEAKKLWKESTKAQRVFTPESEEADSTTSELTNKEIKAILDANDIEYPAQANKATLTALLPADES
jgi:hypothetical protein